MVVESVVCILWTINRMLNCAFCTWPTHNWIKGCILKLAEYHRFISSINGDLYGKPGTKTPETRQSLIELLPLDKHQLIFRCCPVYWPSWISPLPAASPPHFQWDRWEQTASPLLLLQSTCAWSVGPPGTAANEGSTTGDMNGKFPFCPCLPAMLAINLVVNSNNNNKTWHRCAKWPLQKGGEWLYGKWFTSQV